MRDSAATGLPQQLAVCLSVPTQRSLCGAFIFAELVLNNLTESEPLSKAPRFEFRFALPWTFGVSKRSKPYVDWSPGIYICRSGPARTIVIGAACPQSMLRPGVWYALLRKHKRTGPRERLLGVNWLTYRVQITSECSQVGYF